jgi:hypothetical protein
MKYLLLLIGLFFSAILTQAQNGSWKIKLNNKVILSANKEDAVKNERKIKQAEWKKPGNLEIIFTEDDLNTWMRYFHFVDEQDNELFRKDSTTSVKVPLSTLRKLFPGKKKIIIYTTISPLEPNLAIRIRRVHLCTIKLL